MSMASKRSLLLVMIGIFVLGIGIDAFVRWTAGPSLPRVVVVQDKPQEWADALKLGLHDGLKQRGVVEGQDAIVIERSAAGDPQGLTGLAEAVALERDVAVVYTLGTQATQAVFRAVGNSGKNIVFGAVTDPVAAGLYNGLLDKPIGNITGTQDLWPYPAQFDLILELLPKAKKVGIVYNASEVNSQVSVTLIQNETKKRGLELIQRTVTEESQISAAVAGLIAAGIDVFFIPADNTAQTSAQVIINACMQKSIPVFTGIPGIVQSGALATVGTNYYELGKVNAEQIALILKGTPASKIPPRIADKGDLYINLSSAKQLGVTIPDELRKRAFQIYQ
ncbi:MAG: ABC transporter substrate-binding protein [Xanthobacteraceae bacterium]